MKRPKAFACLSGLPAQREFVMRIPTLCLGAIAAVVDPGRQAQDCKQAMVTVDSPQARLGHRLTTSWQ